MIVVTFDRLNKNSNVWSEDNLFGVYENDSEALKAITKRHSAGPSRRTTYVYYQVEVKENGRIDNSTVSELFQVG